MNSSNTEEKVNSSENEIALAEKLLLENEAASAAFSVFSTVSNKEWQE